MSEAINALLAGRTIDFEGIRLKKDDGEIGPGDLYVAERNTGLRFLTCRDVNTELGCIHPTTPDYPFNIGECVKVCEA
jgi:hypothetical protein